MVTIYGILTNAYNGSTKFDKDTKYRISLKFANPAERQKLVDACKDMYAEVSDGFTPKWFKDDKVEYINLKSTYDLTFIEQDGSKASMDDILEKYGSINGSKVGISVNIKNGAVYPAAIKIYELCSTDFTALFNEEDLPF